ncbi:MAG: DUF1559 domain-containing protein [Verrucomicrobiae bacterium]|nr:DUF1559 domain-containing protein [Verrucomicrobiae bacterium]
MMAIVAILVSLLLPVISKVKFQANLMTCRNNLRQIGLAAQVYVTTHEAYPPMTSLGTGDQPVLPWSRLLDLAEPYGGHPPGQRNSVFRCPFYRGVQAQDPTARVYLAQYAYNVWGVGMWYHRLGLGGYMTNVAVAGFPMAPLITVEPTRESAVLAPSDMIGFGDAFNRSPDPRSDGAASIGETFGPKVMNHGALISTVPYKEQVSFRNHRGRFNRWFSDGHLETEDLNRPFRGTDDQLRRWNVDHQPHGDLWRSFVW